MAKYHLAQSQEMRNLGYVNGKAECPACKRRTYKFYVDEQGQSIDYSCGYCDREINCQYHMPPRDYFAKNPNYTPRKVEVHVEPRRMIMLNKALITAKYEGVGNTNLIKWMRSLPWNDEERARLEVAISVYGIGADKWNNTIFWQIDYNKRLRSGKIMKYKPDGHRDKGNAFGVSWVHSKLIKAGFIDGNKYEHVSCYFGEHLPLTLPKATIYVVESEKTALICSALWPIDEAVWIASGGLKNIKRSALMPFINERRRIVLVPDHDGWSKWVEAAKDIGYHKLYLSQFVENNYDPNKDSDNADIADICVRKLLEGWHPTDSGPLPTNRELLNKITTDNPIIKDFIQCTKATLINPDSAIRL